MRKNIIYDYVIPLGERCATTQTLKHYNLRPRGQKLPFDWLANNNLTSSTDCILNNFDDFLSPERLRKIEYTEPRKWKEWHFYDIKTKFCFLHDFPKDLPFDDGFIVVLEKYIPKINLMRKIMESGENILLVHMSSKNISSRTIKKTLHAIRTRFNNKNIDMLVICNGIKTLHRLHHTRIMCGAIKYKTRKNLMAEYWIDTTPEQFKFLDKIFKKISVKSKTYETNPS